MWSDDNGKRNDDSNDDDEDVEEDDDDDVEEDYVVNTEANSTHSDDLNGLANFNGSVRRKQHNHLW